MMKLTINQTRQVEQLARHAPDLLDNVQAELDQLLPGTGSRVAGRIISSAMVIWLGRVNTPAVDTSPQAPIAPPPPGEVVADLVIASRKYGYNSTTTAEAPILWWKLPGRDREELWPHRRATLVDPEIQTRLEGYELIDTKVGRDQIVRWYKKI